MALPIPVLDDKLFPQLSEEARALIPPVSKEWTDFNTSDPGITFLELFAWLAEMQQYRLNRTSLASYDRYLALAGVTRAGLTPAKVEIDLTDGRAMLLPANSVVTAVGKDSVPFATLSDHFITAASVKAVITNSAGRDIRQTAAESHDGGHFAAFGDAPAMGDSIRVGFDKWFESQVRVTFTLFEDDLPARAALSRAAPGFVPSATILWEYLADSGKWAPLAVSRDGTLAFSRSGDVTAPVPGPAGQSAGLYWIRATLSAGAFEVAPRLSHVRVNTVRARQVRTIGNEDLGRGLGTPAQLVRLSATPLGDTIGDGAFEVGEVFDWQALVMRLAQPRRLHDQVRAAMIASVASLLGAAAAAILADPTLWDRTNPGFRTPSAAERYTLAQAFDQLLNSADLYQAAHFPGFSPPAPPPGCGNCDPQADTRRLNRALLRFVFPDLMLSDRVEIQTGTPVANVEDEPNSWINWQRVPDFCNSAPDDTHYALDPASAEILFGNGLNGRVPMPNEAIRARFYRSSQGSEGNLPSPQAWMVAAPDGTTLHGTADLAAAGGAEPESLDSARFRSRAEFRDPWRALTAEDFESLAMATPGLRVAQVKVLPNWNPVLRCIRISGDVTLAVLPYSNNTTQPPAPGAGFLATVKNFLEPRRSVTTRIYVIGPRFVTVAVSGQVYVKKGAAAAATLARVQDALRRFLDPQAGGPPPGGGWPFGRSVFPSEIYQLLAGIEGVDYVTGVALNGQVNQPVALPVDGLPYPGTIGLQTISYEQRGQQTAPGSNPPPHKHSGGCGCG